MAGPVLFEQGSVRGGRIAGVCVPDGAAGVHAGAAHVAPVRVRQLRQRRGLLGRTQLPLAPTARQRAGHLTGDLGLTLPTV